jgi:hypothetical protein
MRPAAPTPPYLAPPTLLAHQAVLPRLPGAGRPVRWRRGARMRRHLDVNSLERDRALAGDPVLVAQQAPPTPATEALRLGALQVQDTTGQDLSLVPDESLYSIQVRASSPAPLSSRACARGTPRCDRGSG